MGAGSDNRGGKPQFEEVAHTADAAFRVRAPALDALFLRAVEGLYRIGGVEAGTTADDIRTIRLRAEDAESLLVQWLNEILFLLEHDRLALVDIHIEAFSETGLQASGKTAAVRAAGKYIKAATYSGLKIVPAEDGFEATIVVDV